MAVNRVLEAYTGAAFRAYPDLLGFDVPERATPIEQASSIAQCLREHGLPVQAYQLVDTADSSLPFLVYQAGGWRLVPPDSAGVCGSRDGVPLEDRGQIRAGDVIVAEPPVGRTIRVIEGGSVDRPHEDLPDVFVAYASPKDSPELAERQLVGDLAALFDKASRAGRRVIYADALGLIPEQTVRTWTSGDEEAAFRQVFATLQRETEGIGRGVAPLDTHSPFWEALGRFLAARKVPSVLEALPYALWKEIVELDRQGLNALAARLLLVGQVDKAAEAVVRYSSEYHRLNCARRDAEFSVQLLELARRDAPPPILVTCRELEHYGLLEASLSHQCLVTHSRILGDEPLSALLRAPLVGRAILSNMGVVVDEGHLRLGALRDCVKFVVQVAFRAPGVRWATKAFAAVDRLSQDDIQAIVSDLNHPTRVFLRQKLGQEAAEQLVYLLRDRGFLPLELDISGLEGGAE